MDAPTIAQFYKNKNIFVTGGSGFIGKVLVEKLLRSCSDLEHIYLLMRPKKGKTPEERIKAITDLPLFAVLKEQNPGVLSKISVVSGDVCQLGLGLDDADRALLLNQVNVVFHGAASVRFDDSLTAAVFMNTRGTREVLRLASLMKNLQVLIHISTAYCLSDRKLVEEKLYPSHGDWEKTIEIAENVDENTLNILTGKYITPLTNTYTFTKSLAEHVVYDLANGKFPAVIFRPSIVISTLSEPIEGWIDNFNGPAGLIAACGKGVIRSVFVDAENTADYVPVDLVVKALIISAWKQATKRDLAERLKVTFYNGSNNSFQPVTMGQLMEMGIELFERVPLNLILWYPNVTVTKCYYYHFLKVFFYQLIPALLIDEIFKLTGYEPLLMKVQRRIYTGSKALEYFIVNEWQFVNNNAVNLEKDLLPDDFEAFSYKKDNVDTFEFFRKASMGGRKYLLKEGDDLEAATRNIRRMKILSQVFNFLWYLGLFWLIFFKIDIISIIVQKYNDIGLYFTTE